MPEPLQCPICSSSELNAEGNLNIRGYKFHSNGHWWSQCLVCSGFYSGAHDKNKGWFADGQEAQR